MTQINNRMNELDGKTWLKYSFTIWRDIKKSKEENKIDHPAKFPSSLVSRLIEIYTKKNSMDNKPSVVLDPFCGSGSALIASMSLGRKGIGIELSKKYIDMIDKNLKNFQTSLDMNTNNIIYPQVINDDSRNLHKHVKSESVDFCVTSPALLGHLESKKISG